MPVQSISYFPPFAVVKKFLQFKSVDGEVQVTTSYDNFVRLVLLMAKATPVDEKWYLEQYPDVREGIQNGSIRNAKHHWVEFGYLEGRLPFELNLDSNWYLNSYSDVANAINSGVEESALSHYRRSGFFEGRLPSLD